MLSIAKLPNVSVFGAGSVTMLQMINERFLIGIVLITLYTYSLVVPLFDIEFGQVSGWTGSGAG